MKGKPPSGGFSFHNGSRRESKIPMPDLCENAGAERVQRRNTNQDSERRPAVLPGGCIFSAGIHKEHF